MLKARVDAKFGRLSDPTLATARIGLLLVALHLGVGMITTGPYLAIVHYEFSTVRVSQLVLLSFWVATSNSHPLPRFFGTWRRQCF